LKPAGLDASKGLVPTQFLKQPGDPAWAHDDEVKAHKAFLKKYAPSTNPDDYSVLVAYMNVHAVELVLKKCGDQLTRENLVHHDIAEWRTVADDAAGHLDQHQARRLRGLQDLADRRLRRGELEPVR
jgi:hypothetical protein